MIRCLVTGRLHDMPQARTSANGNTFAIAKVKADDKNGAWVWVSVIAFGQRRFGMRLTERGFQRQRRMVGIWWLGIGLLETNTNERYERNEPDLAINGSRTSSAGKTAKSGSYGSYGSCDTEKYPESPPVDDEPAASDALAGELAQIARLDIAKLLAGDLSEADWSRITSATVQLSERHPAASGELTELVERIDTAYSARAVS